MWLVLVSTQTTITISWSFTTILDSRNETFIVMYGTTPGDLSMASRPVLSMPSVQQYSVQLVSLQPGTSYYYQINSTNRFTTHLCIERTIRTMDKSESVVIVSKSKPPMSEMCCCILGSTVVLRVTSVSPDSSTLVLTWQPPASPNGDILHYTVRVILHSNGERISQENTNTTTYTATDLSMNITTNIAAYSMLMIMLQVLEFHTM